MAASSLKPEQMATIQDDRGPTVIAVSGFLIGISTVAVALRFAARASHRMSIGLDDWLTLGSLVCGCKLNLSAANMH
jgi:hypothetical protein